MIPVNPIALARAALAAKVQARRAAIDWEQAAQMRRDGMRVVAIAKHFGVCNEWFANELSRRMPDYEVVLYETRVANAMRLNEQRQTSSTKLVGFNALAGAFLRGMKS